MPHLTEKEIEKRIANGEPLPDSVLVEHPWIARKYNIVPVADNPSRVEKNPCRSRYRKNAGGDLVRENPHTIRDMKNFTSKRLESPSHFDRRSFRTVVQDNGTEVIIGCPKGHYDAKTGRCRVGTRAQAIRTPKSEKKRKRNPETFGETIYEDARGRIYLRTDDPTGAQSVRLYDKTRNIGIGWISRTLALHGNPNISANQLTLWVTWIEHHQQEIIEGLHQMGRDIVDNASPSSVSYGIAHPHWPNSWSKHNQRNSRHGNISALKRGMAKHLDETFEEFKKRMIKKHGHVSDKRLRQWFNLRNAGAKALGLE